MKAPEPVQHLPAEAYFGPDWYRTEQQKLFSQSWLYAGTLSSVAKPGDYFTLRHLGQALIVVRDATGELRAFHNICRHRGCELLEDSGNTGNTVVCPYHRWSYQLDGRLRGVPNESACFGNVDRDAHSLIPASVDTFADMVFVNPAAHPRESFSDWLADLAEHQWPHSLPSLSLKADITYEMACNWKLFYENAIDGYHLAYLHDKTLGKVYPELNTWVHTGHHHLWYSTETGEPRSSTTLSRQQADQWGASAIPGTEKGDYPGVVMLFPFTIISPSPWGLYISLLEPRGPEKTDMRSLVFATDNTLLATTTPTAERIRLADLDRHPQETGNFQIEDMWIVEKIQRNLHSPHYKVGPLASGRGAETPLPEFQKSVLDFIN